jgi:hypothetical protein
MSSYYHLLVYQRSCEDCFLQLSTKDIAGTMISSPLEYEVEVHNSKQTGICQISIITSHIV